MTAPPAGWYLDSAPGLLRWFDGQAWTAQTAPVGTQRPGPAPAAEPVAAVAAAATLLPGVTRREPLRPVAPLHPVVPVVPVGASAAPAPNRFGSPPTTDGSPTAYAPNRIGSPPTTDGSPTAPAPLVPAAPATATRGAVEVSVLSLVAVAVAGLTLFFWVLAIPCGILGTAAIWWERRTGGNNVVLGGAAIVVAAGARIAIRTFDSYGPFL